MRTQNRGKLYKDFAVALLLALSLAAYSGCTGNRNPEPAGEVALSAETMSIQGASGGFVSSFAKADGMTQTEEFMSPCAKTSGSAVADGSAEANAQKSGQPDAGENGTVTKGEPLSVPMQQSYIPVYPGAGANAGVRNYGKSGEAGSRGIQAWDLRYMSRAEVIRMLGPIFTEDQRRSGVLASLSMAQFILESGAGTSELALNANNVFGMKVNLSGNTWEGSHWDGESKYRKKTGEQRPNGSRYGVTADFRKYSCLEECIADHSAYLVAAMNGDELRYDGLKGCLDYKKAAQIIKKGGYATSLTYTERLVLLIERWNLTQYDLKVCDIPELQQSYSNGPWEDDRSSPASNRGYKATRR